MSRRRFGDTWDTFSGGKSGIAFATNLAILTTKNRNARPFASPRGYDGGPAGVDTYNDAKRGFYHSMDTNHHDVVHQLLDHETKHVDAVDHLTVNHAPLTDDRATVPSSA